MFETLLIFFIVLLSVGTVVSLLLLLLLDFASVFDLVYEPRKTLITSFKWVFVTDVISVLAYIFIYVY